VNQLRAEDPEDRLSKELLSKELPSKETNGVEIKGYLPVPQ
jgi:hypothetical protein